MAAQVIDRFRNSPRNVCYTCGSAQRKIGGEPERVIDWGIEIVMEGFLQNCETCIKDAAQKLGMMTEDEAGKARAVAFQAEAARAKAERRAVAAEEALRALTGWKTEVDGEGL